jgi:serine phosphatase RsbU (regulator of sigma subunit)
LAWLSNKPKEQCFKLPYDFLAESLANIKMYKRFKKYITGPALANKTDLFDRVKIELTFNLVIIFLPIYTLSVIPMVMDEMWYSVAAQCVGYVGLISMLFFLRSTADYKIPGYLFIGTGLLVGFMMNAILGAHIDITSGVWTFMNITVVFILAGRMWGLIISLYYLAFNSLLILNDLYHWNVFDLGIDFSAEQAGKPPTLLLFLIPSIYLVYVLFKFISTQEKAQTIITTQKEESEKQHSQIIESIAYANQIQESLLPSGNSFNHYFKDSFITYIPKDVVSGDFYWIREFEDILLFGVLDCTGHGVPGAMMSVLGTNGLEAAVSHGRLKDPAAILDYLSEYVESSLSKTQRRDGMDASLCCFNKVDRTLLFAGANNPIYLIRNKELTEIKGQKQPIGKHENRVPFKNESILLRENDSLYLFTDGYPDQFGGPKGKKFKYKPFKQLLISNYDKSLSEQNELLKATLQHWKGNLEQVDDICIVGLKL